MRAKQGTEGGERRQTHTRLQHMLSSHPCPLPFPWLPAHIPFQQGLAFLPGRCWRQQPTVTGSRCPLQSPTKGVPHPRVPTGNQRHLLAGRPPAVADTRRALHLGAPAGQGRGEGPREEEITACPRPPCKPGLAALISSPCHWSRTQYNLSS